MVQRITFDQEKIESSLLAAIVADPETYWEIIDILPPLEAFTRYKNTYAQIITAIEKDQSLPTVNGEPAADPAAAARELAESYQRRLLANLAQDFLQKLRGKTSVGELIANLETSLTKVQQIVKERAGQVTSITDIIPEVLADVKARRQAVKEQGVAAVGLPTGISKLDKLLGGLQPGLHLLAAEPGMGKTTFALQLAANVSKAGYPALYVSFEETLERLALKILCAKAGIEAKRFADGYGDPLEIEQAASKFGPELESITSVA
ncbi:DnaB-like helicase C-terminal domain-containing protein [Neomoorella thermoacetica]|uniref:DnaB-like helicase C-terminal domain-containing protein n=1 Tax=Neomoorella thermoacetica TaxID=1525 RepID=UPI0008FAE5B0|nr:DnaB-like helicase C-terminal domain-containing protein [Moorella thermoacetica]OIQ53127.1 replicative DNA helicase [Moorella thermoacetica]